MIGYFSRSLLLRAGLAMGLVTALALGGMASAVFVARTTHGEAAAVNQAGSLRMQSYHIATALEASHTNEAKPFGDIANLTEEFEQRLTHPRLTDVVEDTNRKSIQLAYEVVEEQWEQSIAPMLRGYSERSSNRLLDNSLDIVRADFRAAVHGFVADIDNLVQLLEEDAESRIHMLGLFQGISLFLTLTVAIATLYLLQIDVLGPLHDLLAAAEKAGRGDFTVQVSQTGADELGRLGKAFNTMAADLSKMYGALEHRVAEKTKELMQRNQSLELLYAATQSLAEAPVSEPTYSKLLNDIGQVVGVDGITLCQKDEGNNCAHRIASSGPIPPMCDTEDCGICLGNGSTRMIDEEKRGTTPHILSIPVGDHQDNNGVLLARIDRDRTLERWQTQLLETLGNHIGISLDATRLIAQRRRLALLEERSVMARELHDSLAQSLTYLKIQVARLSILLGATSEKDAVGSVLIELKQGLEAAYRQLRELLTTFRLQMDGIGLSPALAKTVEEFSSRNSIEISLSSPPHTSSLSVNEEIHVLQIVRESLSNIVHHSQASRAWVRLTIEDDSSILVSVEDNGIGIPEKAERTHHYGLAIMAERASTLNGDLQVEARPQGGTRISLRFTPARDDVQHFTPQKEAPI